MDTYKVSSQAVPLNLRPLNKNENSYEFSSMKEYNMNAHSQFEETSKVSIPVMIATNNLKNDLVSNSSEKNSRFDELSSNKFENYYQHEHKSSATSSLIKKEESYSEAHESKTHSKSESHSFSGLPPLPPSDIFHLQ